MTYRLLKPAALCCAVAVLAGCAMSPIPLAENFALTVQKKVRSAGHWSLLSRDIVDQTVASLQKSGATLETTVHVPMPANASDFGRAFHEFLITELVQRGWHVLVPADNINPALTLTYQTQIVTHNSERPHFVPGLFTTLTAGVMVAYNAYAPAAAIALAAGADIASGMDAGGPTHTELLLTTTVTNAGRYISRKTDVYYVEESDTSLFASLYSNPAMINVRTMKVVSQ